MGWLQNQVINMPQNKDFLLTIQSGGIIIFEKTGVLPQFLIFNSKSLQRTWRVTLQADQQQGVILMNGVVAYTYFFDGLRCKMQSVVDGVVIEEWEIDEIGMEMRD